MSDNSRVTLVIPRKLWEEVKQVVPSGQRSRLVTEALEAELRRRRRLEQLEDLQQFQQYMRGKYGELPSSMEDIKQMREQRDDDIASVR